MQSTSNLTLKDIRVFPHGQGFVSETISDHLPVYSANTILNDPQDGLKKRKIGISLCSGCPIGCVYCVFNRFKRFKPLSVAEIVDQVEIVLNNADKSDDEFDLVKISFKQMGDPMANPIHTVQAIEEIMNRYTHPMQYVVSTSGVKYGYSSDRFFLDMQCYHGFRDKDIRLQFSLHTTSDSERQKLIPGATLYTLNELGTHARFWQGHRKSKVTLNFVMMKGYSYEAETLAKSFDPASIFVKINYFDHNKYTKALEMDNERDESIEKFKQDLAIQGIEYAHRNT